MPTPAAPQQVAIPLRSRFASPLGLAQLSVAATSPLRLERSFREQVEGLIQETFISFARIQDSVSIWAADSRGMQFCRADLPAVLIDEFTDELLNDLSNPQGDSRRTQWLSKQLYRALVAPIERFLDPSRRLVVHFAGDLRSVPLGLLESASGDSLMDCFSYGNAVNFPWQVQERRSAVLTSNSRLLVVETPIERSDAGTADAALDEELRYISTAFPCHDMIRGGSATREQANRLFPDAQVLHWRGKLSEGSHGPQLHFASGGGVHAQTAPGDPTLVPLLGLRRGVLSECSLGVMDLHHASRLAGASQDLWRSTCHALHSAGIAHVVIPRWNVPSGARRAFHEALYANLKAGVSISEACRSATLDLRARPEWSDPHYWAGFTHSTSHL